MSLLLPPFVRPVDLELNVSSTPAASFYSSLLFVLEVHLIRRARLGQRNRQRVWRRRWAPGQLVERIVEEESAKKEQIRLKVKTDLKENVGKEMEKRCVLEGQFSIRRGMKASYLN